MSALIITLAIAAGIIGIAGSILPGLPGPPVSWLGLLILYLRGNGTNGAGEPMSLSFLLIWLAVTVIVCIVDYVVPASFTRVTGGSKADGNQQNQLSEPSWDFFLEPVSNSLPAG